MEVQSQADAKTRASASKLSIQLDEGFAFFADSSEALAYARLIDRFEQVQDTIKIDGTVPPAYTINRILGRIPIVGNILRGDKADAALAATFSVTGSLSNPQVFVNPLAALVPGMVRDLFNALSDGGSQTTGPIDSR